MMSIEQMEKHKIALENSFVYYVQSGKMTPEDAAKKLLFETVDMMIIQTKLARGRGFDEGRQEAAKQRKAKNKVKHVQQQSTRGKFRGIEKIRKAQTTSIRAILRGEV